MKFRPLTPVLLTMMKAPKLSPSQIADLKHALNRPTFPTSGRSCKKLAEMNLMEPSVLTVGCQKYTLTEAGLALAKTL